jgi:hypothetical protein
LGAIEAIGLDLTSASPRLRAAFEYWSGKRQGRAMPSRRDLDPCDIPRLLPNIVLVDVQHEPTLDFRYRLIGSAVFDRMADDLNGLFMSEIPHQRRGTAFWNNYALVAEGCRPRFVDVTYVGPDYRVRGVQDMLMPLSNDGYRVNMIFAAVEFEFTPDQKG